MQHALVRQAIYRALADRDQNPQADFSMFDQPDFHRAVRATFQMPENGHLPTLQDAVSA